MSNHTIRISEPHPNHQGCVRHYYATVDVQISSCGNGWIWMQVDMTSMSTKYIGQISKLFDSECLALEDAVNTLNGDGLVD